MAMAAAAGFANSAVATGTYSIGSSSAPIAFVQVNYSVPSTPQSTVTAAYTKAQTAGDTNVVAIGWSNSTSSVTSVTDTKGNTYNVAVGPTVLSGVQSQIIYVAKNIAAAAAGANTVTVKFSAAVPYPDVRILEYSGLDPVSPVDVTAGATGTSATSSSGSVTTTSSYDLIFSANYVTTSTNAAGNGFISRVVTSPDGDIAEDQIVTATGTYTGTANLTSSGSWIMQTVALRGRGTGSSASRSVGRGSMGSDNRLADSADPCDPDADRQSIGLWPRFHRQHDPWPRSGTRPPTASPRLRSPAPICSAPDMACCRMEECSSPAATTWRTITASRTGPYLTRRPWPGRPRPP